MSEISSNTIIVTGCAGFIGFHICEHYLKNGFRVYGIDNLMTGQESNLKSLSKSPLFKFVKSCVTDNWESQLNEIEKLKYIFHFASPAAPEHYQKFALETMSANSIGLEKTLKFADKYNAKVIFASTSEIYGDPQVSPQKEDYWGHVNSFGERSCYDEAKRFGEALIYSHNKKFNTKHGIVRIFNTYGPQMNIHDGRVVTNLLRQALNGENLTIYGDGTQTRSFCYISDLITALERYASLDIDVPVNLGNDEEFSVSELAAIILEKTGSRSKIVYKTLPSDDPKTRRPDLSRAKKLLSPWQPEIGIYEGLEQMIHWMKAKNAK